MLKMYLLNYTLIIELTKIECIKITDKYNNEPINNNVRNISYGIDTNKFVYLNVEFSKKI